jgi:manganese/iron transport system permease protein
MKELLFEPFQRPFMARALVEVLLLGALGAGVGVFVMLRRLAFLTDALTHTVFPGVVIGFLVAGHDGIVPGALVSAVAAAALFTLMAATRRIGDDAAVALLLTTFFAVGVVLVSRQRSYTSDLTAFLFGRMLTVDATDITWTAAIAAGTAVVLLALRKELLLRAFDPEGAAAAGYRVWLLDATLNMMIAMVVVASVRAVGTVLVIALIVVPVAAARLLSDRLVLIVPLAIGLGMAGGWLGLVVSYEASVSHNVRLAAGGTIVLVLVAIYIAALAAGQVLNQLGRGGRLGRLGRLRHRTANGSGGGDGAGDGNGGGGGNGGDGGERQGVAPSPLVEVDAS